MKAVLATGYLNVNSYYSDSQNHKAVNGQSKNLGYEFDYSISFAPRKGVTWINEFGMLIPGKAWGGDAIDNYDHDFTYGFQSKAAISLPGEFTSQKLSLICTLNSPWGQ